MRCLLGSFLCGRRGETAVAGIVVLFRPLHRVPAKVGGSYFCLLPVLLRYQTYILQGNFFDVEIQIEMPHSSFENLWKTAVQGTGLFRYLSRCLKYSHTMTAGYFKMNPFLFESPMIFKLCKNIKKSWYNICAGQCPSDCRWPARCTKKLYTDQFLSTMRMQSVTEIAHSVLIQKNSSSSSNWHINEHKQ